MTTVKHMERLWEGRAFERLARELIANRIEASFEVQRELMGNVGAAALGMIRLCELDQPHVPLYAKLVRNLIACQDRDGGWINPAVTALALRALSGGEGTGVAIERGMTYLANLQQPQGSWPMIPIRRAEADAGVTAFILYQLGTDERFGKSVNFPAAVRWLQGRESSMDAKALKLWQPLRIRCRPRPARQAAFAWS